MTKKHFAAIAAAIFAASRTYQGDGSIVPRRAIELAAEEIADRLVYFNGSFNRARFLAACRGE